MLPLLFALFFAVPHPPTPAVTAPVRVELTTQSTRGDILLAVYGTPEAFAAEEMTTYAIGPVAGPTTAFDVDLPAPGTYVVAAFHDLNRNGKLDRNLLGVPTEPYGFSQVPASRWRAPDFGEVAVPLEAGAVVRIELRAWGDY